MLTVISHIFNEELLLPYWLKHHKTLFDHGILIDFGCTDKSLDIVHDLCPTWEIVPLKYPEPENAARMADWQIMEIEDTLSGWKVALNTTEFIVRANLKNYLDNLPPNVNGLCTQGYYIIETPRQVIEGLTDDNLLLQRTCGYIESQKLGGWQSHFGPLRHRLIHRLSNGDYSGGRHFHKIPWPVDQNIPLAWFGWGLPKIKKARNQSIQTRWQRHQGFHCDHQTWTDTQVDENWRRQLMVSYVIPRQHPVYRQQLEEIQQQSHGPS